MILSNCTIGTDAPGDIVTLQLAGTKIASVTPGLSGGGIDLGGAPVLPGLINSHDHLDFNLFPLMVNRKYQNYREWGKDIQQNNREAIDSILKVPPHIRTQWGVYKNLLNGFTTVVHHGNRQVVPIPAIAVCQTAQSLHSPGFERNWRRQLYYFWKFHRPVAIHIGEGIDTIAAKEVEELVKANRINRRLIGVHGIAMQEKMADHFAGLVWCPDSNYQMFGMTAQVAALKDHTLLVFGTDSTLTADWNTWNILRKIAERKLLAGTDVLNCLTVNPARLWRFRDRGVLTPGNRADLLVPMPECRVLNGFPMMRGTEDIQLLVQNGEIKLIDTSLAFTMPFKLNLKKYSTIRTGDRLKYVFGNLEELASVTRRFLPGASLPIDIL